MKNDDMIPPVLLAGLEPLSRRRLLSGGTRLAVAAGALLALPGQVLAGDRHDKGIPPGITHLSALEYRVFDKLRVVMLPTQKYSLPSSEEVPVMQNVDDWVGKLNRRTRLLLKVGADTLEYGSLYRFSRFSQMSDEQAVRHVHGWQTGNVLQRGIISSLKMLVELGYWQDIRTWPSLQYDGPVTKKWGIRSLGNAPLPR